MVSDETLEGLGTTGFLLQTLFGSLLQIARPGSAPSLRPSSPSPGQRSPPNAASPPRDDLADAEHKAAIAPDPPTTAAAAAAAADEEDLEEDLEDDLEDDLEAAQAFKTKLTGLLPEPGYFLAGAISGGVSRTVTAPLDRLKVYLLVNTQVAKSASLDAAKVAARTAATPVGEAIMTLWKTGGFRTFFAGERNLGGYHAWHVGLAADRGQVTV